MKADWRLDQDASDDDEAEEQSRERVRNVRLASMSFPYSHVQHGFCALQTIVGTPHEPRIRPVNLSYLCV